MSEELRERMTAIGYCLGPLMAMLSDAETHALPGKTLDGLLLARRRLAAIQAWLAEQSAK